MKPNKHLRIFLITLLPILMALAVSTSALALESLTPSAPAAPEVQPHFVSFATSGLLSGIPITITGTRVNPGSNPVNYALNFTSPGPSGNLPTRPGTEIIYFNGFPAIVEAGGSQYNLISVSPTSPFTAGLSGESTVVLATYSVCSTPVITSQPVGSTKTVGEAVTFSVSADSPAALTYQWRKNGVDIPAATGDQYTISAVQMSDAGAYDVVVSNDCSTVTSDTALLTVAKISQSIDFPQPASPAVFATSFPISPTASSGLTVTVTAEGGCVASGSLVPPGGVLLVSMTSGTLDCTLSASQDGDDSYAPAAPVEWVVTAAKAGQTIDFPQPPSPAARGSSFTVSPSSDAGLPVSLLAEGSCSAQGFVVTIEEPSGACILTASQAGDENYLPAEDVQRTVQAAPDVYPVYLPMIKIRR